MQGPDISNESIAPHALRGRRVLVVEDDPVLGMVLENALVDMDMIVVGPAATLCDALQLAATSALDCAILDVNLGREDSFPVAALLRAAGVPLLFATAHRLPADGPMGDARVLCKPYGIDQLLEAVGAMLADGPGQTLAGDDAALPGKVPLAPAVTRIG